ncbi:serine hydrolase domain-containing protein [Streptomyces sp. SID13726]|uniref:serine hydrolase domain-containing protein n=1 Tax=Streptomyces sp. SID13726 TaxID=2706058 RepID=UPI0013B8B3C4|nr:serine hydrolase domain-containing protein [Streptomyces sp. SID13726]NEB02954.1 beta-lactamase family protein [Streptomyces sp. SID13726]
MRDIRRRSILTGALAVPLSAALPVSVAQAHTTAIPTAPAPGAEALRAAIAGLPDADATAALVRVGGSGGGWRGSSGVHDLESRGPADPAARFRAGSTTKVVTAAAVLRLAREGRIDLCLPVQHYLPGLLGRRFRPVTVRQLLNHTSGIPAGDGLGTTFEEVYAHRFDTLTPQRVAASAGAKEPEFRPGGGQHYLNINYTFLGLLIERVTGRPYASEATRLVLAPAGMRDTYFPGTDPRIRGPHNRGYQAVRRADGTTEFLDVTEWNQADRFAAGDMISTTADLERLLTALFRGRIVRGPQLAEMFTVPSDVPGASYSAGLQRFASEGKVFWAKSGGRYGYNSAIAATRDLSRTLVCSVNSTDAKSQDANPVVVRIVTAALK